MANNITSANAGLILSVPLLLPVQTQIQGFETDDIFDTGDVVPTETRMGVDGFFVGGFVFTEKPMTITLSPASPSCAFFESWQSAQQAALLAAPVGAYLRGGNVSALTLAQLQAISGVLTVTIDGTQHTSSSINLSAATSFSNASELITTALGLTGPTDATITTAAFGASFTGNASGTNLTVTSVTGVIHPGTAASASITGTGVPSNTWIVSQTSGTTGGAGVYVTNQATTASSASITCQSNVLDVTTVASGTIAIGQQVEGSSVAAGTYITALGTGTGGAGTYITTQTQNLAAEAMTTVNPVVTYDSVSGAFVVISSTTGASSTIGFGSGTIAASLALTQATGAVTSQGSITAQTQNWATFQTLFDPDAGSGNAQKQLFAAWTNAQNNRYAYLAWDNDITPTESTDAASSLGQILKASGSSGTACIYEPTGSNLPTSTPRVE